MSSAPAPATAARPAVERVRPPAALIRAVNPVVRRVLCSPAHAALSSALMVLTYSGRHSGRTISLPVAFHELDGGLVVFSNSEWRLNFRGGRDAELVLRGKPTPVRGTLIDDADAVADVYARRIGDLDRRHATRELGIRINVDRAPTRAELLQAIASSGLSLVRFAPR